MMQHQLRVVPVVGLLSRIEDFKPVPNIDEVDAVFDVPLEMFLKVTCRVNTSKRSLVLALEPLT